MAFEGRNDDDEKGMSHSLRASAGGCRGCTWRRGATLLSAVGPDHTQTERSLT